jgi:TetR/AcrR family transcriptional regulator, regulator of autoinduction and epiphytic fitness
MTDFEHIEQAVGPEGRDGRAARRERNRDAIVDAIMVLVNSGELEPTMARVAELSGVSERSIFRIFETRDALLTAVIERQVEFIASIVSPLPTEGPLADRLAAFVRQRSNLYEQITPMRLVALRLAQRADRVARRLGEARAQLRAELELVFGAELVSRTLSQRRELVAALDLVTSWEAWHDLRTTHDLSVARASRVMDRSVTSILAG